MPDAPALDLLVNEADIGTIKLVESAAPAATDLAPGEIFVKVEKFGFTANNVTYAALGRTLRYFEFFPASEPGWGKVPVWGMGTIVHSRHPERATGTRMYGYFPLARSVTLRPARMSLTGFEVDRGDLASVYNQYHVVGSDPFHLPASEDQMMIFRPLIFTSLFLDDYLADGHGYFGAETVLVSSASSKTSYGTAFMHARRGGSCRIVGLTSPASLEFTQALGFYDEVLTYDDLPSLAARTPVVFVDVAGNLDVRRRVQAHFGDALKAVIIVGMSHWDKAAGALADTEPSVRTEFFFVPSWVEERQKAWGIERLFETVATGWQAFMAKADQRCRLVYGTGPEAVATTYRTMLESRSRPDQGCVLSLWDDAFAGD
jgi:hypothetical protein